MTIRNIKIHFILILLFYILIFVFLVPTSSLAAPQGFGGQIVSIQPCRGGLLLTVRKPPAFKLSPKSILPNPTKNLTGGGGDTKKYFWDTGNLMFPSFKPPKISQFLLGMSSGKEKKCRQGHDDVGSGEEISLHGSN